MTAFLEPKPSTNFIDLSSWTIAVFPLCDSENLVSLLSALLAFRLLPAGFANRQLREHAAPLIGLSIGAYSPNRATYDLRRLRLRDRAPLTSLPRNRNRNENRPMLSTDPRSQPRSWYGLRRTDRATGASTTKFSASGKGNPLPVGSNRTYSVLSRCLDTPTQSEVQHREALALVSVRSPSDGFLRSWLRFRVRPDFLDRVRRRRATSGR